jgi:hypothetical protein
MFKMNQFRSGSGKTSAGYSQVGVTKPTAHPLPRHRLVAASRCDSYWGRRQNEMAIRLVGAVALVAALPAFADSWIPATQTTYFSSDKATRLTVVPRDIKDQLAYFTDKVDGKEPAGQRHGGEPRALGILERRSGQTWTKVWEVPLVNEVAPVEALSSRTAADTWLHSTTGIQSASATTL